MRCEHLAEDFFGQGILVRFGGVDIAHAREEGGLHEAGREGPACAHAELGDFLAGLAERDQGHGRIGSPPVPERPEAGRRRPSAVLAAAAVAVVFKNCRRFAAACSLFAVHGQHPFPLI